MSNAYPRVTAAGLSVNSQPGSDVLEAGITTWAYFAARAPVVPDWYGRATKPKHTDQALMLEWEEDRWFGWRDYYATKMARLETSK